MLFRRVAEHVSDQNWTAVFIELVIVVVGVFIGLEVANWNDENQRQAEAERPLSTLVVDLTDVREGLVVQRDLYTSYVETLDGLMDDLEAGNPVAQEAAIDALTRTLGFHLPRDLPLSFEEMLSAGRMDGLESPEIRTALRDYATQTNFAMRAAGLLAASFTEALDELRPILGFVRPDVVTGEFSLLAVNRVDVDALGDPATGYAALTQLYQGHLNMVSVISDMVDALDAAQETIAANRRRD